MHRPEYAITIPSKTYSYLACGRPILAAAEGDVADLIQEVQAGLVCQPEDADALAAAIRKLFLMPGGAREVMGNRGRQAFLTQFAREITIQRYEGLFTQLVQGN
jgi:glycosyltransferase involved in cell wall biosynthesis